MKKLIFYCFVLAAMFVGCCNLAYADDKQPYEVENPCEIAGQTDNPLCASYGKNNEKELYTVVKNVLQTVYFWIGILAVIMIIISGINYTTSQGDPGKVAKAKSALTYSIIGVVVSLSAFAITEFTLSSLSGKPTEELVAESEEAEKEKEEKEGEVTSLRVVSTTTVLEEGTLQLKVEINPSYAKNRTLTFTSSDPSIATVSETGLITAKKPGVVDINIQTENGIGSITTVTIKELVKVQSIEVAPQNLKVLKGKTAVINAIPLPSNAVDKTLTWTSANPEIATVNNKGIVKGKKVGATDIIITSNNGITAKAKVTVIEPDTAERGENGAFKITDELIQHLDSHYNQSGNWFSGHQPSCTNGDSIAATACGQSSYMAVHYVLTSKDLDYIDTVEYSCSKGSYSDDGTWWDRMTYSDYQNEFHITGKYISHSFDAHVAELTQGHPVVELICGRGGFRATTHDGCHFVVALSYRENNGGEIYVWNPTNINQGWVNRSTFTDWITNRNKGVSYAMWKI